MQVAIWDDPDWCRLDVAAQHAYWLLMSSKGLSYCGVLDYVPGRFRGKAKGLTAPKLKAAVATLQRNRFVVLDEDTSEALVRTYVRHDKVMERRNMGKAVAYAYGQVVSPDLQVCVRIELARLHHEHPELAGWAGFEQIEPDAYKAVLALSEAGIEAMQSAMQSAIASPIASAMPSAMASPIASAVPSGMESGNGWGVE